MAEFMFPVKFAGTKHIRVEADSLEEAMKKCNHEAETAARYEMYQLTGTTYDVLVPVLVLLDEDKETWPYWGYGYHGTDGVDWRVHYTNKGKSDIPSYAEEIFPVPENWLDSWKKES